MQYFSKVRAYLLLESVEVYGFYAQPLEGDDNVQNTSRASFVEPSIEVLQSQPCFFVESIAISLWYVQRPTSLILSVNTVQVQLG